MPLNVVNLEMKQFPALLRVQSTASRIQMEPIHTVVEHFQALVSV